MAVSAIQQPPSPPHSRHHYFPPQSPSAASSSSKNHSRSQHRGLPVVHEDVHLVKSRLPTGLPERNPEQLIQSLSLQQQDAEGLHDATIEWNGGGRTVYVTGVADRANDRIKMTPETSSDNTFITTVKLPPGNHPLRFIVDDQVQVSDTLPTATDTDGTLINYIEVPSPTKTRANFRHQTIGWSNPAESGIDSGDGAGRAFPEMPWTSTIPPRLFKLAAAEEAYLTARAAASQSMSSSSRSRRSPPPPLPPPPPVPYPPSLPRHLEKVILNSSSSRAAAAVSTPVILTSATGSRPRVIPDVSVTSRRDGALRLGGTEGTGDDNSVLPVPNHVVLNHLGTSAIKNGVLAVGTTTRYHRKYISTIYYKPVMS